MAKHSFERTWPRWAGPVADLEKVADEASGLLPGGRLNIEVHRIGLGTSEFESGAELAQALTIPDLARVDLVAVRVDRPRAQELSLVAVSFTLKIPAVTVEAKGTSQELVSGAVARLSRAVEGGVQFPRSHFAAWQAIAISVVVIVAAIFDGLVLALAAGKTVQEAAAGALARQPTYPGTLLVVLILIDLLAILGGIWLLTPFELLPAGASPRLKRFWVAWVLPLLITLVGAAIWSFWSSTR